MRRYLPIAVAAIIVLLVLVQLILPGLAERRVEDRLTEGGGSATVSIDAVPAARLLVGDGDRIDVTGRRLDLDLDLEEANAFHRLDGFGQVDVTLDDFRAGPFRVASFALHRDDSAPYALRSVSTTTASDLVRYGSEQLDLPGGPLLGLLAGEAPKGHRPIPITLNMKLESDDGRIQVVSGGGTVAGYPTGPLAEILTAAIVVKL